MQQQLLACLRRVIVNFRPNGQQEIMGKSGESRLRTRSARTQRKQDASKNSTRGRERVAPDNLFQARAETVSCVQSGETSSKPDISPARMRHSSLYLSPAAMMITNLRRRERPKKLLSLHLYLSLALSFSLSLSCSLSLPLRTISLLSADGRWAERHPPHPLSNGCHFRL